MKTREEIDNKFKIDLSSLFKNDDEFINVLDAVEKDIELVKKYNSKLLDDNNLINFLRYDEEISRNLMRLYIYAHINNDADLSVEKYNNYTQRVISLFDNYSSFSSFVVPELLNYDECEVLKKIKNEKDYDKYELSIKKIFRHKDHTLSKNEEYILSKLTTPYSVFEDAFSKLTDVDLTFGSFKHNGKKIDLNPIVYYQLSESSDRNLRKKVFKNFYKAYKSIINTNCELIRGNVKKNNALAEVRKFDSAIEKALFANEVDEVVYANLLKSIENNLNIIHKQWKIYKDVLNLKDMHLYDINAPIIDEYDKNYSYDEAKELIIKSLDVLGSDYVSVIKRSFDENWIDVYPNENKRSGAYCTCCYETHPYVLTNFSNRYSDVSTITHELGHAMHYYYAMNNNYFTNYDYSIFVAEVASQVNEILLCLYIMNNSDDKNERLNATSELIKHFKSSVVRQTMFAEFEKIIHDLDKENKPVSPDALNDIYYNLNKKYYGKNITIDEEIKYEWSRIPHFYYNFYVYQYATGYIAALKIANDIYNKKEGSLEKYINFLKLGSTKNPVESLKVAGVDLTTQKAFDDAFNAFDKQLDEFYKFIKEVNNE